MLPGFQNTRLPRDKLFAANGTEAFTFTLDNRVRTLVSPLRSCRRHLTENITMAPAVKKTSKPIFKTSIPFTETHWSVQHLLFEACIH